MTHPNKTPLNLSQSGPPSEGVLPRSQLTFQPILVYICLGILFLGYVLLTQNGYGNHDDIYRMIGTWRTLISEHRYVPSRFQGNLIPELIIGLSSQLGGFHLSNLVSAVLAITSLLLFYRLLSKITVPLAALLAVLAIGTNPFWVIPAVTSTDYIYSAFFLVLGLFLLLRHRPILAGLIFALAVSSRINFGPLVVLAFAFYFPYLRNRFELRNRFFGGILVFVLGAIALYLPVFFASGMTFSFLGFASETSGGTLGIIVRFLYKNVYLWGLPAFILLLGFFLRDWKFYWQQIYQNPFRNPTVAKLLFHGAFWSLVYSELVFSRLPHQYQYILAVLFCVVYFITLIPSAKKQITCLSLLIALHIFYSVCNIDVIDTYQTEGVNQTIHSDGGRFHLSIKDGVLIRDFKWRSIYQHHLTEDFNQRWQHFGAPLENPR